jgi:hypothetical protein
MRRSVPPAEALGHAFGDGLPASAVDCAAVQPTAAQIEAYRRDGFLVVEQWLDPAEVERAREHFARCFAHEWETGLMPDEVNYDPKTTPPDRTRRTWTSWSRRT